MSTYNQITRHPQTGTYEVATWHDDYFGHHIYGVEFSSDKKVYPENLVERAQIYDFWKDDVLKAYEVIVTPVLLELAQMSFRDRGQELALEFLNEIEHQYKLRWKADPITGNGATENSRVVKKK